MRTLNFKDNKIEMVTLQELQQTYHEDHVDGVPVGTIYHFDLLERVMEVLEKHRMHADIQEIFAANNRDMGNMDDRDFETYMELFEQMMQIVRLPELMIYLRASVPHLVGNIQKRGRDYEQSMQLEYLENLNRRYDDFIYHKYKGRVLSIDVDQMDFLHNPSDLGVIIDRIDRTLFGLFSPSIAP
jgi:deoxyadenosine/deoxycytidine kinase